MLLRAEMYKDFSVDHWRMNCHLVWLACVFHIVSTDLYLQIGLATKELLLQFLVANDAMPPGCAYKKAALKEAVIKHLDVRMDDICALESPDAVVKKGATVEFVGVPGRLIAEFSIGPKAAGRIRAPQ